MKTIQIKVSDDIHKRLKLAATEKGCTIKAFVMDAVGIIEQPEPRRVEAGDALMPRPATFTTNRKPIPKGK